MGLAACHNLQPESGGDGLERAIWPLFPIPSILKTPLSSQRCPPHLVVEKRGSFSFKDLPLGR